MFEGQQHRLLTKNYKNWDINIQIKLVSYSWEFRNLCSISKKQIKKKQSIYAYGITDELNSFHVYGEAYLMDESSCADWLSELWRDDPRGEVPKLGCDSWRTCVWEAGWRSQMVQESDFSAVSAERPASQGNQEQPLKRGSVPQLERWTVNKI